MLFGEYLLERRALDEPALLRALDEQQRRRPFLGAVAVAEGALGVREVLSVLAAQVDDRRSFGVLAVEMGLLTEERLDRLLARQRAAVPLLGETLVSLGCFDAGALRGYLEDYFRESPGGP